MFVVLQRYTRDLLQRSELEKHLAKLEEQPGFLSLELLERCLSPGATGDRECLVLTRWRFQADFDAWTRAGGDFDAGGIMGRALGAAEPSGYLLQLRRNAAFFVG